MNTTASPPATAPRPLVQWNPRDYVAHSTAQLTWANDMTHTGRDGLAAWVRTTWLPYTQRLPEDRREAFVADAVERYLDRHPPDAAGQTHVAMVRLEVEAMRL